MKVVFSKVESFQPVEVKFTFEFQDELDAFGSLFNYAPMCSMVKDASGVDIMNVHRVLLNAGAKTSRYITGFDEWIKDWTARHALS